MQSTYWIAWKEQLIRWNMRSFVCGLLLHAKPLIPLVSQLMVVGLPLFKVSPMGSQYWALVDTLSDDASLEQLAKFLKGREE